MSSDPQPSDKLQRLRVLEQLRVLDTRDEPAYDAIVRLAADLTGCPIALVSLVDDNRVWFKARVGAAVHEVASDAAFCAQAIAADDVFVVLDAATDPRFAAHPTVAGAPRLRFYAGAPIRVAGCRIGTVSVMSPEVRGLSERDRRALLDLAVAVGSLLEARLREQRSRQQEESVRQAAAALSAQQARSHEMQVQLGAMLAAVPDLWFLMDREGRYLQCSAPAHPMLPLPFEQMQGRRLQDVLPQHLAGIIARAISAALQAEQVQRIEYERVTPDGVLRHLEVRISPMQDGRTLHLLRDLTDLRTLERDVLVMQRVLEADASLPITVADATLPDQPLIYVNPAFERLSGYRRDEVIGHNCRFLNAGHRDQPALDELRQALADGRSSTVLLRNARKDGSPFINELHVAPIRDAAGRVTHFIGVHTDVTERTRAAEKLQVSEELYRSVAGAISDGLLVVTQDHGVAAVNPAGCRILGMRQAEVVGPPHAPPLHLLDEQMTPLPSNAHPVWAVLAGGPPLLDRVFALRRPDGDLRWLSVSCQPLRLTPGDLPFSVVVTFRDITEQRRAEQALSVSEERWKFALEGSGDGVWDYDGDSNAAFYSRRWKEMLGYAEHEIGTSLSEWRDRVHPDDKLRVLEEIRRYRAGEIPAYEIEYRLRHRNGHDMWILDRGKIVARRPDGSPLRVVGTHRDVTRQKLTEEALRDKQAAELANRAKTEFLSRMSHEMRTPLNAVIGFAQLLKLQQSPSVSNRPTYADHILQAGQHLLALVNDVLDLQQVEEGRVSLNIAPVALAEVAARCTELLAPMAQARGVTCINAVTEAQAQRRVWADKQRLRQVLLNVASNAIKYNRPGGQMRIAVEAAGDERLALLVEDNGYGMTSEQMSRLFQPFERLGRETSAIEGTGLGLIIARGLIQEMGGSLAVASRPGAGTQVRIELPSPVDARRSEHDLFAPSVHGLPLDQEQKEPDRMRMLYVEDNRINALLFEETLKLRGHIELRVAEDGEEAHAIASEWRPDVLVLDAHLPGLTGFEVLQQLRRLPGLADVPAFMCSADAMPEDVQRALAAGFIGYWTKPIDVHKVMADLDVLQQS
jgi:PAS domain S-box-containing protein